MILTFERPDTLVCPKRLSPQPATVPLDRSAKLCRVPAASATTLVTFPGTSACKLLLFPQAMVESAARLELAPRQTDTAAAIIAWRRELRNFIGWACVWVCQGTAIRKPGHL